MGFDKEHPNWAFALRTLQSIVPEASSFMPDDILKGQNVEFVEFGLESDIEKEMFDHLLTITDSKVEGLLTIVADSSYIGFGPYFVSSERVGKFFDDHSDSVMTSGDLVIVCPATKVCVLLHHDGLAVAINRK